MKTRHRVPIWLMGLTNHTYGYTRGGITGSLATDAGAGLVASVLLGGMLFRLGRRGRLVDATS